MNSFKRDKKEEEDGNILHTPERINPNRNKLTGGGNPFQNIEKTTVLQEARTFNETPVNPRKCAHILTKILYLLNQVNITLVTNLFYWSYLDENVD